MIDSGACLSLNFNLPEGLLSTEKQRPNTGASGKKNAEARRPLRVFLFRYAWSLIYSPQTGQTAEEAGIVSPQMGQETVAALLSSWANCSSAGFC